MRQENSVVYRFKKLIVLGHSQDDKKKEKKYYIPKQDKRKTKKVTGGILVESN